MAHATISPTAPVLTTVSPTVQTATQDTRQGDDCRRCGRDVTRLDMVRNGLELQFVSCSDCDVREWMRNGEVIDLDALLSEMIESRETEQAAAKAKQEAEAAPIAPAAKLALAAPVAPETRGPAPLSYAEVMIEADPALVADVAMRFVA